MQSSKYNNCLFYSSNTEVMDSINHIEAYFEDHDDDHDDYEDVPVNIQEDIRKCILEILLPDMLHHMSEVGYHKISGVKIYHVSLQLLGEFCGSLEPAFNKRQQRDLYEMHRIFLLWGEGYCKKDGKELVGAAIRLSKAIGKEEHVDMFKQIVKDCFIPNKNPYYDSDPDYVLPWYLG